MLKTVILSIYEFPEPARIFGVKDGGIGVIFKPDMFYKMSAWYDIGAAMDIVEKPIIHDADAGEYLMYLCKIDLIEGMFYIFIGIGFDVVAVNITNAVYMYIEKDFEEDYDLIK